MEFEIVTKVPDFSVISNKGLVNLHDYAGKFLVIYFYPKDNTPGCTMESIDFRDLYPQFKKHNAEIIGVSRDSVASHTKFECKYDLPFPLIADTDSKLCDMFDIIKKKSMFGKTALGVIRSTFLISPTGELIREWRNVKVAGHAQEVLNAILT